MNLLPPFSLKNNELKDTFADSETFTNLAFHFTKCTIDMNNMILSSAITAIVGFIAGKLDLNPTIVVPAVSALAGILLKQNAQNGATSGLIGGGVLGAVTSLMGDPGLGGFLSSVLGENSGMLVGSLLGGGILGGAGGGIGGLLQGMTNKSKS